MTRPVRWLLTAALLVVLFRNAPAPLVAVLAGGTATLTLLGVLFAGEPQRRAARRRQRPLRRPR